MPRKKAPPSRLAAYTRLARYQLWFFDTIEPSGSGTQINVHIRAEDFDCQVPQLDRLWHWFTRYSPGELADETGLLMLRLSARLREATDVKGVSVPVRIERSKSILHWAQHLRMVEHQAFAHADLGIAYGDAGNYDQALACHQQEHDVAMQLDPETRARFVGNALSNQALIHARMGDYQCAIELHETDLRMHPVHERSPAQLCHIYSCLGSAFSEAGEFEQSCRYLVQALDCARLADDSRSEGIALGTLALCYKDSGRLQLAISCFKKRIRIARDTKDLRAEATALGNLGIACRDAGLTEIALQSLLLCIDLFNALGDAHGVARNQWNLGLLYEDRGDFSQAVSAFTACVEFERKIGHADYEEDFAYLCRMYEKIQKRDESCL